MNCIIAINPKGGGSIFTFELNGTQQQAKQLTESLHLHFLNLRMCRFKVID